MHHLKDTIHYAFLFICDRTNVLPGGSTMMGQSSGLSLVHEWMPSCLTIVCPEETINKGTSLYHTEPFAAICK